jgi:predicted sugar kinase
MTTIEISEENLNQFFERVKGYIDAKIENLATAFVEREMIPADWNQTTAIPETEIHQTERTFDSKAFAQMLTRENP